jgi:hypothetical protein
VGLVALVLAAPASAHILERPPAVSSDLDARAAFQKKVIRHDVQTLRFFRNHRWIFGDKRFSASALRAHRFHTAQLRWTRRELKETLAAIATRERRREARRITSASPVQAIQRVFGDYAYQALAVARCESGLSTWARNGQYLGLFQMGSNERATYGHGSTPHAQAVAAHRYFVASGRDWSPWGCKPW